MSRHVTLVLVGLVCFLGGCVIAPHLPFAKAQDVKGAKFVHGLEVKVRKAGEADFTTATKTIGVEVFRDENNNNLIYVTEGGSIAVVPGK
jgi:hypothetical protein